MDFSQFHFIRPLWLLLLPVVGLLWFYLRQHSRASQWQKHIPAEMLAALQLGGGQQALKSNLLLLAASILLIVGAAGPTWNQQPVPIMQNQHAMVLALDLSPSMLAQDLKPDRLTQAKYKLIDILRARTDGQTALIAYAADAHTVSPLTDDPNTIEVLLPALHPQIMPASGSNTEAAIALAQSLMSDAGAAQGDILLITDGIAPAAISNIEASNNSAYRLSILGVGGSSPAPIPTTSGGFLRGIDGEIVLTSLNERALQTLAASSGGNYAWLTNNNDDINRLLIDRVNAEESTLATNNTFDAWQDMGYLFALLVLPIAALFFRKGLIYVLPLMFILPIDSEAQEQSSLWQNLWNNRDQQASELLAKKDYQAAADTFKREDWSAVANYKAGNFATAADLLNYKTDIDSQYNRANALALNGDLNLAQELYKKVLEQQPEHADAAHNNEVIEKMRQQQEQEQQGQDSQSEDGEQQKQNNKDQEQGEQSDNQQQDSQNQKGQEQADQQQGEQSAGQQNESESESNSDTEQTPRPEESNSKNPGNDQSEAEKQNSSAAQQPSDEEKQPENLQGGVTGKANDKEEESESTSEIAEPTERPLKDASEQWLRSIVDDPSGLLRRKFQHQANQNARKAAGQPTPTTTDQRY